MWPDMRAGTVQNDGTIGSDTRRYVSLELPRSFAAGNAAKFPMGSCYTGTCAARHGCYLSQHPCQWPCFRAHPSHCSVSACVERAMRF